jgi:hypothetical protein
VRLSRPVAAYDRWVRRIPLSTDFGDADDAPAVAVTMRDLRCAMVNVDPDGGSPAPEVMKACVRANENHAGIYCTVTRTGRLAVGRTIVLHRRRRGSLDAPMESSTPRPAPR